MKITEGYGNLEEGKRQKKEEWRGASKTLEKTRWKNIKSYYFY